MLLWLFLACNAPSPTKPSAGPALQPSTAAQVIGKLAPSRDWNGLALGSSTGPEIEKWLSDHKLLCAPAPASRRMTVHYSCESTDLNDFTLPNRTVRGKLWDLLLARPDGEIGALHYVGTTRRYSIPGDAILDFDSTRAALTATLGEPTKQELCPGPEVFADNAFRHYFAFYYFDDLRVELSLNQFGGGYLHVTENWTVPGVEDNIAQRGEGSLHGGGTGKARPNPHILPPTAGG